MSLILDNYMYEKLQLAFLFNEFTDEVLSKHWYYWNLKVQTNKNWPNKKKVQTNNVK